MKCLVPRDFVLIDEDQNELRTFSGARPRTAALKAAYKGNGTEESPEKMLLLEKGTDKVHVFYGGNYVFDSPKNRPSWLPDVIRKPFAKKAKPGIIRLGKLNPSAK